MADAAFSTPPGEAQDTSFFSTSLVAPQTDAPIHVRLSFALAALGDAIQLQSRIEEFRGGVRAFNALSLRSETAWNETIGALQTVVTSPICTAHDLVCRRVATLLFNAVGAEDTEMFVRAALHPHCSPCSYAVDGSCAEGRAAGRLVATALSRLQALGDLQMFQDLDARQAPTVRMPAVPVCAI